MNDRGGPCRASLALVPAAGWTIVLLSVAGGSAAAAVLEDILVTAQKREESLQEVPITMQAFSGDQLTELNVTRASGIVKLAPNLNISTQNPANRAINIRGVGTSDFFGAAPGSVGIYLDEVTMSSPYLTAMGLYDMERVEILRGPQNTLFGRNTTGGAVNYISRKPVIGGERDGYVRAVYGSYDRIELEAASSFNLGDSAAFRIAGYSYDRDGIWDNVDDGGSDYGEKDRKSVRGTFAWEPGSRTSVSGNLHWGEEDSEINPYRHVGTRVGDGRAVPPTVFPPGTQLDYDGVRYTTVNGQGLNPSRPDWEDVIRTGSSKHEMDTWGAFLRIDHEFDFATLTSITAYDDSETLFSIDAGAGGNNTPTPVSITVGDPGGQANLLIDQDQQFEQFSQEFRFTSPADRRLRWIAGLYYFTEDAELSQNIRFGTGQILGFPPPEIIGGSFGLWVFAQQLGMGPEAGYIDLMSFSIAEIDNEVWSPYLQLDYDITPDLTLTAGLRYTDDVKELPSYYVGNLDISGVAVTDFMGNGRVRSLADAQLASGLVSPVCNNDGTYCAQDTTRGDLTAEEWGGKIGLSWRFTDDQMVYGHYSRGFRSGKYDIEFLHGEHTAFPSEDADPETLDAFEIGYKSSWLGNSLQFNAAAFFYIWKDKQTFFVDPATGPQFSNTPESEILGAELELQWLPGEDWYLSLGLGLLDTEVTEASPLGSDEKGHELQQAPPYSINALVRKDFRFAGSDLILQADYQYRDDSKSSLATVDLIENLGEVELLGLRATYAFGADRQYEISAFGEDLLESRHCEFQFDLSALNGVAYCVASEGQALWGLEGRLRF